jgi:hypothetical protein
MNGTGEIGRRGGKEVKRERRGGGGGGEKVAVLIFYRFVLKFFSRYLEN